MINLLPPKEKERLLRDENQKIGLIWGFVLFVFLISLALIILLVETQIRGRVSVQELLLKTGQQELEGSAVQELQKDLNSANRLLSAIEPIVLQDGRTSELLGLVAKNLPAGLYLTQFSYQRETGLIALTGFSPARESLLLFRKNLEDEKRFSDVVFPPENWIKAKDIEFKASITLQKL